MKVLRTIITFVFIHLTKGVYILRKAPEKGRNVCIVGFEKTHVKLQRHISKSRKTLVKDCGIDQGLFIKCEKQIIKTEISYVPVSCITRVSKIGCCPGWKDYIAVFGCLTKAPCLSLPLYTPSRCVATRQKGLEKNKNVYSLQIPPSVAQGDPNLGRDLQNLFLFPLLNMTFKQAAALSWNDPVDYPWLVIYTYLQTKSLKMLAERMKPGNSLVKEFKSIDDFQRLLQLVRTIFTKDGKYLDYFRYPSLVEKWKDIIRCQTWHDDQVFVEERLAALNPMSLERVTADIDYFSALPRVGLRFDFLTERLNRNYNWNRTVSNVVGRPTTLYKMAREKSLFAIHYPYLDDLPNVDDITEKRTERRRLKNATSPIAIFVSVKRPGKDSYELKPVAIQTDCHSDSPVYTPHDGKRWLLAKYLFQLADFSYVEMVEHLLKTHTILQPICVILKRTISRQHPLNEMLKWHCRGLIATNANGFAKLIQPHGYMHTLFSMGHLGSIELLNRAYQNYSWKDNDFWENIKSRGVDDPVKLPYYPYRDDGYLIWKQLHSYVREYVSLYYYNNNDVRRDFELRAFTTELSEKGMGKLKGFPSMLQSKYELIKTLTRILWLPVQHNAVNYPIAYYGAFVPNMPSKLYDDARSKTNEFSFNTLPNSNVSTVQAVVSMGLGSLRFDQLLDYGAQMLDKEAGEIVKKHHHILMTRVRDIIDERNEKRYSASHLTYPYLKPGWIPNSIHT